MNAIKSIGLAAILGLTTAASAAEQVGERHTNSRLLAASPSRGQLLYENHCTVCHTSIVHVRENHKAKSVADLRGWATRWAGELNLKWSEEEINDVATYLARRYYQCDEKAEKC